MLVVLDPPAPLACWIGPDTNEDNQATVAVVVACGVEGRGGGERCRVFGE